jgi:Flp pilus assembly protein TadG
MKRDRVKAQRGMTLVTVCLLLVALLALAALCIDLGILYTARTSAQHAADAAALAGAYTFVINPGASQPAAAQQAAIAVAGANKVLGQSVAITSGNVVVDTTAQKVTVTVPRTGSNGVGTFFAKAMGVSRVDVQVQATARASLSAGGSRCIKPIYIPNTVLSTKTNYQDACTAGEILFDPSTQTLTDWGRAQLGNCVLIRPTSPSDVQKGGFSSGQFFSLDFGSGGSTYRCTWSECMNNATCRSDPDVIACNNSYPIKTGDMVGPTKQGVDDLTGPDPDVWVGPGDYEIGGSTTHADTSKQVSVVPVWDNCSFPINSGTNGQTAKVIGFLEMFVDGMGNQNACVAGGGGNGNAGGSGNYVKIHTINATGCAGGSGGGGGGAGGGTGGGTTPTGPAAVPVQLVKN